MLRRIWAAWLALVCIVRGRFHRCMACGNRLSDYRGFAVFVPAIGPEGLSPGCAGAWCHHGCLANLVRELRWCIKDAREAGHHVADANVVRVPTLHADPDLQ